MGFSSSKRYTPVGLCRQIVRAWSPRSGSCNWSLLLDVLSIRTPNCQILEPVFSHYAQIDRLYRIPTLQDVEHTVVMPAVLIPLSIWLAQVYFTVTEIHDRVVHTNLQVSSLLDNEGNLQIWKLCGIDVFIPVYGASSGLFYCHRDARQWSTQISQVVNKLNDTLQLSVSMWLVQVYSTVTRMQDRVVHTNLLRLYYNQKNLIQKRDSVLISFAGQTRD